MTTRAENSEKNEMRHTDRLFGTNSLKEGAMWRNTPLLDNSSLKERLVATRRLYKSKRCYEIDTR
jgi:hypothetical protein